jgi:hypothetical protein
MDLALRPRNSEHCSYFHGFRLRRSALDKFTEIQIPSQPLKSRLLTALEVLPGIAGDPAESTLVRVLAKSALAKDKDDPLIDG